MDYFNKCQILLVIFVGGGGGGGGSFILTPHCMEFGYLGEATSATRAARLHPTQCIDVLVFTDCSQMGIFF